MRTVRDFLSEGASQQQVDVRLHGAYEAFLNGRPSKEDCEIILVDLASFSGYYNTTPQEMPAHELKYVEGMRAAVGRIFRLANMPFKELQALQAAVLREQQGDLF